jgi:hypothetical protein
MDNVAVALEDIETGTIVNVQSAPEGLHLTAAEAVPFGHKIAVNAIAAGEAIVKYGAPVGRATSSIVPGAWVHMHNVSSQYAREGARKA